MEHSVHFASSTTHEKCNIKFVNRLLKIMLLWHMLHL